MRIESQENLGCNFFCSKKIPCRKHTDAYRGIKAAPGYLARAGPDSTSKRHIRNINKDEKKSPSRSGIAYSALIFIAATIVGYTLMVRQYSSFKHLYINIYIYRIFDLKYSLRYLGSKSPLVLTLNWNVSHLLMSSQPGGLDSVASTVPEISLLDNQFIASLLLVCRLYTDSNSVIIFSQMN